MKILLTLFCAFLISILDQLLNVTIIGHAQNELVFLPCEVMDMKKLQSWAGFFSAGFVSNNQRTNNDLDRGYCVTTVRTFCTTLRKVVNRTAQN